MSDQIRISDTGELEIQPLTWDDQPVYSQDTIREGLFSPEAFEQMPGQLAIDAPYTRPLHCLICGQSIQPDEIYAIVSAEYGEAEHNACTRAWINRSYGAEGLS